ncbi:hypothetical protein BC830DRAFT_1100143 [Chytriomyces sp. MP71]|nr:hypothetical protein BC830DRAFT_1100143 [Chytriomyces sp. MP71]
MMSRGSADSVSNGWNVLWSDKFKQAYKANYSTVSNNRDRSRGQPVLSSTRSDGSPKSQALVFLDVVSHDPRALIFAGATRNQELMSVTKLNQTHELFWYMPKSNETFVLSGKMFICSSPSLSGRYGTGPKNINLPDTLPVFPPGNPFPPTVEDYWQSERDRLWKELSPAYRASYTWPNSGESQSEMAQLVQLKLEKAPGTVRSSVSSQISFDFKHTKLDIVSDKASEDAKIVYNMAYDNFCLLVFRVLRVDHTTFASDVPVRNVYTPTRDGAWAIERLNP